MIVTEEPSLAETPTFPHRYINVLDIINNTFQYISHGLDVHQGCSPVVERNVYRRDESSGQQPGIHFDIVRVAGRSGESEEQSEQVITISREEEEQGLAQQISKYKLS